MGLILTRAVLYLVAAVNVSNNPHIALTAIVFTVSCIILLKGLVRCSVYNKWPVDVLETCFYFNIVFFAIFMLYSVSRAGRKQEAVAYISVVLTVAILLLILIYHMYMYTPLFSKLKMSKSYKTSFVKEVIQNTSLITRIHHLMMIYTGLTKYWT